MYFPTQKCKQAHCLEKLGVVSLSLYQWIWNNENDRNLTVSITLQYSFINSSPSKLPYSIMSINTSRSSSHRYSDLHLHVVSWKFAGYEGCLLWIHSVSRLFLSFITMLKANSKIPICSSYCSNLQKKTSGRRPPINFMLSEGWSRI